MFRVNTVCIGQNVCGQAYAHYNGMECVVISPLESRLSHYMGATEEFYADLYMVRWASGVVSGAHPVQLRKKPEKGETSTGEDAILNLFKEPAPPVKTTTA